MVETKRTILPIKERIAQFRWKLDGRSIPMGVGCAYVGEGNDKEHSGLDLLLRCYDEGFRYYDSSRSYINSEPVVGQFVKRIDRNSIFLSTKSHFNWKGLGAAAFPRFRQNFEESFEHLGTDHIDLFLIHDTDNIAICMDEVIPFLREQREKGRIDYIGMGTRSLVAHREAIATDAIDASEAYLTYSLLKRAAEGTIRLAAEKNKAYINASLLHFGVFKRDPSPEELAKIPYTWRREQQTAMRMKALCQEMGISVFTASLQFSMLNPDVDMVLNGINRMSNIDSTIRSMREVIYPDQWGRIFAEQRKIPNMFQEDAFRWYFD